MKKSDLLEKLRVRRELLDFSQDYMGIKLDMSQPAYSFIENGQTRLTDELLEKIKTIKGFENFDEETPLFAEHLAADERIPLRWPWGQTSLNSTIVIVVILLLNLALFLADHSWRGFGAGVEPDGFTLIIAVVLLLLFGWIMYLLFRLVKWLLNRRRR